MSSSATFVINDPIPIQGGLNDKLPKPPFIEIRRSMSQPADPDAPSFLTMFTAEIRNAIYKPLFSRSEPIPIIDPKEQKAEPSWYDWKEYCPSYQPLPEEDDSNEEDDLAPHQMPHNLEGGFPLLLACRQVYQEAIGIVYGTNTFLVTVPYYRHSEPMDQLATAAKFLGSIGTNVERLGRLLIDVDPFCPGGCTNNQYMAK